MQSQKNRGTITEAGKCLNTLQSIQYRMSTSPTKILFGERCVMQDAVDRNFGC